MSNRTELVDLVTRKPGLTAREIGEALKCFEGAAHCAEECLALTKDGRISRARLDGIYRYYPAGRAPRGEGEPAVSRGRRREAAEAESEPDTAPAPRAAVNRPTVTADWLVFGLPGGAVAVINKESQAGVRLDAGTVAAIVEAANAAA